MSEKVFTEIYNRGAWGLSGDGSGIGSEPSYNQTMQKRLAGLITRFEIKSIVDVSCGACKWQADFLRKHPGVSYYGIDIARPAINRAKVNLKDVVNASVRVGDLRRFKLPSCDMVICRDTLQHMSYKNIMLAIDNMSKCKTRLVVIGGYKPGHNIDIMDGNYFDFNPTKEPFNLVTDLVISEKNDERHPCKHLFCFTA